MLLLPILAGTLAWLNARNQEKIYEAESVLLVQQRRGGFSPGVSDFSVSGQLAVTYGTLVGSTPFLKDLLDKKALETNDIHLSLDKLKGMINADTGERPPTVTISVRSNDRGIAQGAANIVALEFIDYVVEQRLVEIANFQSAAAAQGIANVQDLVAAQSTLIDSITFLEPATRPGNPILPRTRYNITLAVILGGIVAVGVTLLLSNLRDTVRSPDELRRRFNVASLGTIFKWTAPDVGPDDLVVREAPSSGYSEAFRQMRANIQFATAGQSGKHLLVTSPGPAEGKTTILCNLAIAMAHTGKRVVVVDGDLRRPTVHRRFKLDKKTPGLSNFLADQEMALSEVLHATQLEGVSVVPGGLIPPNPSELLGSPRMADLLEQLAGVAELVLVDSPPVLIVADAPIIAAQLDGAIVVVDGFKTKKSSLRATLDSLSNTQINVLGVVLNKLKRARFGYGYGYPYYYDYYYYQYTSNSEGDEAATNEAGPVYKRPFLWVRSVFTRSGERP